ncbi:hypothetical protein D3C85_1274810 [compost metagenome]
MSAACTARKCECTICCVNNCDEVLVHDVQWERQVTAGVQVDLIASDPRQCSTLNLHDSRCFVKHSECETACAVVIHYTTLASRQRNCECPVFAITLWNTNTVTNSRCTVVSNCYVQAVQPLRSIARRLLGEDGVIFFDEVCAGSSYGQRLGVYESTKLISQLRFPASPQFAEVRDFEVNTSLTVVV